MYTKKLVLLGQFGVGKTSLVRRFMTNEFLKDYRTTLGVQIKKKELKLPSGEIISLIIWDLEGFSSVLKTRSSYLLGTHGFIYVFDLTRPATYYNLEEDIKFIKSEYPDVVLKIIGNKSDEKDPKNVKEYLKKNKIEIHGFTSAKTGDGVNELFTELAENIISS
jgi:small GTP-binding protein